MKNINTVLTIYNQVTMNQLHSYGLSCPEPLVQCSLVCHTMFYHHIHNNNSHISISLKYLTYCSHNVPRLGM